MPWVPVAALPSPSLPTWITSVSPQGRAQTLSQVRVIFGQPIAPLSALESTQTSSVLSHIQITPRLKGHFVLLTPRMIGFVPEQALPRAARIKVTLIAGLSDLKGDALKSDLAWTFQTDPIALSKLPQLQSSAQSDEPSPAPVSLQPKIEIVSNTEVVPASLESHASLQSADQRIDLSVQLKVEPTLPPGFEGAERFDPSLKNWRYTLTPKSELRKATTYRLVIEPGVEPAIGNVASAQRFLGALRTYSALAFTGVSNTSNAYDPNARFATGDPLLHFNNPIDPKSLAGNLSISPAPKGSANLFSLSSDGSTIAVNPYELNRNSTYTINIGDALADTFGQRVGKRATATVSTGDFAPGFWAPSGNRTFPSGERIALNLYATNLVSDRYRAYFRALAPTDLVSNRQTDPGRHLIPPFSAWPVQVIRDAKKNQQSVIPISLAQRIGAPFGLLAYGAGAQLPGGGDPVSYTGMVQLTNLAVFAQWFPQSGSVMVQRLSDGAPVSGAKIEVYRSANSIPCAAGSTNANGTITISGAPIEVCYAGDRPAYEAPELLIVAKKDTDWSYVRTESYSGAYEYNVYAGWSNGQPESRGTIYSDRQLYQPGEKAWITGIAYFVQNGVLKVDRNATYTVKLTGPTGAVTKLVDQETNTFGTFSFELPIQKTQALGYYSIDATGSNGNQFSGQIRVAEFKPPNFKVALSLDKTAADAGSVVTAAGVGRYLFGAPLDGGKAHINVTRDIAAVSPKGWDQFSFGPQWFWPQEQPTFTSDVLQTDIPLDKQGAARQAISVPAGLPFPMTYQVDFQATDISNLAVTDSKSFTAYPSRQLIGVQSDFVGAAGQALPAKIMVTDPNGAPISGVGVHVELQAMQYAAATQVVEGGEQSKDAVQFVTVDKADIVSVTLPQTVRLLSPKPGAFRIVANLAGAKSEVTATDTQVYLTGQSEIGWSSQNPNQLKIALDKKNYKPGELATALIASPYRQADLYISVVRHDVIYKQLIHLNGGAPRVQFRVTAQMVPNAAVEAVLVRRGAPLHDLRTGALDSLVKIGMVALHTDLSDRYLKLNIHPKAATLEPGTRQTVNFTLTDSSGKPAAGQLTVAVANEAVLQLSGYRLPDLVQTVFADQSISTRFADSRFNVVLKALTAPTEKGWGYGGGFMAGASGTRVRANFQPLAYFNGSLKTDSNGHAGLSFTLPDNLSTWRIMAVATGSDDFHFAQADTTFVTTKPLVTNALLPQFARPGDIIDAGLSALNVTGKNAMISLSAKLSGALRFVANQKQTLDVRTSVSPGMNALRYPMLVDNGSLAQVEFRTLLGSQTDAFAFPLELRSQAITEQTIDAGSTGDAASIPIDLRSGGVLRLTLASSILPQITVPAEMILAKDSLPFAESQASRLTILSALSVLARSGKAEPVIDSSHRIADALSALAGLQRADGGFAAWDGAPNSDVYVTPYAARSLGFARSSGARVNDGLIARSRGYLEKSLADPARLLLCEVRGCTMPPSQAARIRLNDLIALAALGSVRNDFLSDIYAQRESFDTATQIQLARYLLRVSGWRGQGTALAAKLSQSVNRSGRYASVNLPMQWAWLDSPTTAQAQMLELLVARGEPGSEIDGTVSALLAQQCRCGWSTLYDTAQAVRALSTYSLTQPQNTNFSATAAVGGKAFGAVSFSRSHDLQTFTLRSNAPKASTIELQKSGTGTLHYLAAYSYLLSGDQPGAFAGLRVVREIRAAGETSALATYDLAKPAAPLSIASGNVFNITVRVIADHPIDNVVITDPLPAGFEAVDATFKTNSQASLVQGDSWQIDFQTIHKDRVVGFASHLGPGIYEMQYVVRSV
ncbi:MAG: Ig-like domain-containing protein, partial [Candidatus Eremiobacteraeota bacterium]|nr:Ig-like domain-containing protein [Candidatus Eremiobacteraeota bacterium]